MGVKRIKLITYLGSCALILLFQHGIVLAGPVRRSSRMIREVYPEIEPEKLEGNQAEVCIVGDVVYGAEEPVPADQPCLKCKCQPPGVQCETTKCVKKPGCRAIHKSNKCCPEYQCECEHEGRLYANGERLETPPGGECKVCYCRGGEVQCAEVSCYIRTDCEGRTVPGQCCPKYDHCPPREPLIDRVVLYTTQPSLTSNALDYWPSLNTSSYEFDDQQQQQSTPTYDDIQEVNNKITETQTESNPNEIQSGNETIHVQDIKLVDKATQTDPLMQEGEAILQPPINVPKITIQEIIPEIKEIPITGPPKREINLHMHGQFEGTNEGKVTNKVDESDSKENLNWLQEKETNGSDLALGDTESDSSEISEIYHHPPPVLKIGDQLLFLKKGELVPGKDISTPVPVITIIGAEGLQRGTEDSGEYHEVPSQVQYPPKDDPVVSEDPIQDNETTTDRNESKTHIISLVKSRNKMEDTTKSSLSTIEDFLFNLTQSTEEDDLYSENLDSNTTILADNVVNKIKSLTNVESTTDVAHLVQKIFILDVNDTEIESITSNYEEGNASSVEEHSSTSVEPTVTLLERLESAAPTSTESASNTTTIQELRYEDLGESKPRHDEDLPLDQNPEYPPIPDIMSSQNVDELSDHVDVELTQASTEEPQTSENSSLALNETSSDNLNESISEIKIMKASKQIDGNSTTDQDPTSHPLINIKAALPTSLLRELAPSDVREDEIANHSTESDRSKETLELTSEESGESTTPQNKHASIILSVEDASVETPQASSSESQELNLKDLVETISTMQTSTEESKDKSSEKRSPTIKTLKKDVELINPQLLIQNSKPKQINKTVNKPVARDESDIIFDQLNEELKSVPSRIIDNNTGNEDAEAEAIFRELLEEASSSTISPTNNGQVGSPKKGQQKETELLQRVSDAITKFQLKESKEALDTSILGILREFFSSQYKYYDKEK